MTWLLWIPAVFAAGYFCDRALLRLEERGVINYRRRGLSKSGAGYHALNMHSVFNPEAEHLGKARYEQVEERDESGDPAPPGSLDEPGEVAARKNTDSS